MSQCARMHGVGNSLSNLYLSESKLYNLGSSYISCMFNGKDTNEEVDMQGNATYKNDQWQQSTSLREVSERTNHSSNANGGAAGGVGGAFQEDEMLWWLQYPMEESYERGYCSGMFGELPNTNLLSVRELGYRQNQMGNKIPSVEAEAAMALGAERAAGLASQVGLEAFCRVRTSMQPPVPKWPTSTSSCAYSTAQSFSSSATTPPAIVDASLTPKSGPLNFPQFGVTKQQGDASDHQGDSLITETSTSTESLMNFSAGGGAFPLRISSTKDNPDSVVSSSCERNSHEHSNGYRNSSKRIEIEQPTITSCSGGSAATNEKRKARQVEDWQSEEAECESSDMMKRPPSGRTSTKRSRAAEVHNLSERRRRDRINEKMRALQELIPNSNKTDKASMLDEAIEYLKMLQLQLQMMSMRSGMSIPPMIMPNGMQAQPMQMTQVPYVGNVGMSMGMGMGMGMSMGMGMGMGLGMGVNMGMSMGFVESKPSSSGATGDAMESFPSSSHQIQPYVLEQQPRAATTATATAAVTATAAAATATTTATAAVAAAAVTTAAATTSQCQF